MKPKVSIIVPVYKKDRIFSLCLQSLANLDYPKDRIEVMVVDNFPQNTPPRIKRSIETHKMIYIIEESKGWANAKNKGIDLASGDLIAFIDSDSIADKNWLAKVAEAFDSNLIGACGGRILSYTPETPAERYIDNKDYFSQSRYAKGEMSFLPWIMTCNAVYRRSIFKRVGYFDNLLRSVEDTDLSWRICLAGLQIKYVEDAVVYHKRKNSFKALFDQFFNYGYGQVALERKYRPIIKRFGKRGKKEFEMPFNAGADKKKVANSFFDALINLAYLMGKINAYLLIFRLDFKNNLLSFPESGIYWWWIDKNIKILNWENLTYSILNKTASEIWDMINKNKDRAFIKGQLKSKYKIDEESAERDINEFLAMLNEDIGLKLNIN